MVPKLVPAALPIADAATDPNTPFRAGGVGCDFCIIAVANRPAIAAMDVELAG
jgi:hypothetical protein